MGTIFDTPTFNSGLASLFVPGSPPAFTPFASLTPSTTPFPWIAVRQRFEQFHRELLLTPLQTQDGQTKRAGVVNCLNRHYYNSPSETDNSFMIGSWGKNTAVRRHRSSYFETRI
jgi:hypothetical protein